MCDPTTSPIRRRASRPAGVTRTTVTRPSSALGPRCTNPSSSSWRIWRPVAAGSISVRRASSPRDSGPSSWMRRSSVRPGGEMRTPAAATWRAWTLRLALRRSSCSSARSMASSSPPAGTAATVRRDTGSSQRSDGGPSVTDFDPTELHRTAHIPDLLVAALDRNPDKPAVYLGDQVLTARAGPGPDQLLRPGLRRPRARAGQHGGHALGQPPRGALHHGGQHGDRLPHHGAAPDGLDRRPRLRPRGRRRRDPRVRPDGLRRAGRRPAGAGAGAQAPPGPRPHRGGRGPAGRRRRLHGRAAPGPRGSTPRRWPAWPTRAAPPANPRG